ncbi:MAG: transketolase [Candidatus Zixiibacteriota bacterium]|nr:MAG: transketolase [candidate division Zixibacteria bacterium]
MPIIDSNTGRIARSYSFDELKERANYMRGLNLVSLWAAGSGHPGGTLSVMDIGAALYLNVARHDPDNPEWPGRDRIIWSAGHKAPALYTCLGVAGYFPEEELYQLRMLGSRLQGHPHWKDLPGIEISTGSLGQGLSVGVGMAMAAKLNRSAHRIFVITSDGEQQEGSIWEAVMSAAHHRLDNLIQVIDKNSLQIDGLVADVMNIDPLIDKYRSFGWIVISVDGHNLTDLVTRLETARNQNQSQQPVVVICHTTKGKGVSFMEGATAWHGKAPNRDELEQALHELGLNTVFDLPGILEARKTRHQKIESNLAAITPEFSRDYWWNRSETMKVKMEPTRKGFGRALDKHGGDERVVCIGADISDSICIADFHRNHPERKERFISVGIAEQNATTIAAGLAREGKLPIFGTYGVFASARNLDQLRVSVCYSNLNVLIVGAHGGVSVGPDGATHQELESIFQITGLPNMTMLTPCDSLEAERITRILLFDIEGPKYLRLAREATPIITDENSPLNVGEANIFRYRSEKPIFREAFEIVAASDYSSENEGLTIISCGPETAEALRAACILKSEHDIETRVLHLHTLKPIDKAAIVRAAQETNVLVTVEEHQVGGLGNLAAGVVLREPSLVNSGVKFRMIGVPDRFGESGEPWQLIRHFGLAAENIARQTINLLLR